MRLSKTKLFQLFITFFTVLAIGGLHPLQILPLILKDAFLSTYISHLSFILLLFIFIANPKIKQVSGIFLISIVITITYLLIYFIFSDSFTILSWAIGFFKGLLILLILLTYFKIESLAKFFIKLNIVLLGFSIIGVVLVFADILHPLFSITSLDHRLIYFYGLFATKVNLVLPSGLNFVRPSGIYDEPGTFAFISMLCLLLNKKYFDNKKYELFLLIGTLITFSLAHIITSLLYLMIFYPPKRPKYLFLFFIIIFSTFTLLSNVKNNNQITELVYSKSIGRLEKFISGNKGLDNRQVSFDDGKYYFSQNPFGIKPEFFESNNIKFDQNSFMGPLVYLGIIGIIIYLNIIFQAAWKRNENIYYFKFLFIIIVNLLQRPYIHQPIYILLIYLIFYATDNKSTLPETYDSDAVLQSASVS